jgi:hypothetical protein
MNKKESFILNEVFDAIRKAKQLYSDARREKDISTSTRIAVEADNHIDKATKGLQSILYDEEN